MMVKLTASSYKNALRKEINFFEMRCGSCIYNLHFCIKKCWLWYSAELLQFINTSPPSLINSFSMQKYFTWSLNVVSKGWLRTFIGTFFMTGVPSVFNLFLGTMWIVVVSSAPVKKQQQKQLESLWISLWIINVTPPALPKIQKYKYTFLLIDDRIIYTSKGIHLLYSKHINLKRNALNQLKCSFYPGML